MHQFNKSILNIFLTFFFLFIMVRLSVAQSPESLFDVANQTYKESNYSQAAALYQKILENGYESGEVYFNLGNTYYKMNEIGLAILYYEKAKLFISSDQALEQNLNLARLRVVDQIESIPKLFLEEWWDALVHLLPLNTFLWLSFILFTLTAAMAGIWMLHNRTFFRRLIWFFLTMFTMILLLSGVQIYQFETTQFGIILDEKVSVLGEPDLTGTEVFILHEGTKVKINRRIDGWFEITIPDGKTGWLLKSNIGVI